VRGRETPFGERVDRGLVLADMQELRGGAHLVERAAQEHFVRGDTGEIERARRQQEHAAGGARQVVLAFAAVLEERGDVLPRRTEVEHRVAQFLHLAPEREVERRRHQHDAGDARVALGEAQALDEAAHRRAVAPNQLADDVVGDDFVQLAARPQHERRPIRD
jgi:hypothetical protein